MVQNRIVQFIIDNWKDIGIFFTGIWAVFIAAKKAYLNGFVPLKAWIKKMDEAATQLEYNGGSSTKDMVRQIKEGQDKLLKKVDIVNNRQTAMIELNDLALFENDNTGK